MHLRPMLLSLALAVIAASAQAAPKPPPKKQRPTRQTVCTITVNSADEKEVFRRYLPASRYDFVELVEHGRADWLASSCRAATSCDVLIVSGHFDGDNEFFSDRLDAREYLTVSELERASCSNSCPKLFSRLKEVYLFGCNTLNPRPQSSVSSGTVHDFVHGGRSPGEAARQLQALNASNGQSSLDRMRQLFRGVPVIYGFSSTAPLGATAGGVLDGYFRGSRGRGPANVADGRPDAGLLRAFSTFSMTAAAGITDADPQALQARRDMCGFADDRLSAAARLGFVHELMQRPGGEARRYLDRIQRLAASLDERTRREPAVAQALAGIAADTPTRERFLEKTGEVSDAPDRVRRINLARELGWLTDDQRWQALALMLGELQERRQVGVAEIDLACQLNDDHELEGAFARRVAPGSAADDVPHAAMRACLGSSEARAKTLDGLVSQHEADVQAAQAFLRRRPIADAAELRTLGTRIAAMPAGEPQVRALEVLGRHYVSDAGLLSGLAALYAQTPSAAVQNAVAGVLIRADRRGIDPAGLRRELVEHRRPAASGEGEEMVDALLAQLAAR